MKIAFEMCTFVDLEYCYGRNNVTFQERSSLNPLDWRNIISLKLQGNYCCDMGQNDTIGKIELKIIFRLAVGISNSRNDIQLFLQLFDELRVNGDYH